MPHPLRKVVVVFKTHFDLGFTDLPDRVMQLYTGKMFSAVREVMDATANEPPGPRYSWTLPAWPLRFLLHDPSVPEESRQAARKLVEEGRLNWHAWPFTTHTAFCGLEELVRGLHISRSLSEEFGKWPTGAKQTDVPGHTWILPSILVRAGVKFVHLGCNSGSHPPHVPRLFWWEGPDASRLLTYYSAGGYGTPLLPPDDWPYDTWLAVQQTVDNIGPQSPEELKRIRRTIEEGAPGVELLFGELGDFADSLLEHPEQLEGLPVVPYDLADTWIHGIGTMPREVARVRELRAKLLELEQQAAIYDWPRPDRSVQSEDFPLARKIAPLIDAAYEQLLLFGEHTWGLDVKSTIKRVYGDEFEAARDTEPYKRLESSWVAKAAYVDQAERLYNQALQIAQSAIGEREAETIEVWEPPVLDGLPENILETDWCRIEVDPEAGSITSFYDKHLGREWVDRSSPEPFGGYRYDLYSIVDIAEFMRGYGLFFQDWFVQDFGKQGYPEDSRHVTAYARNFKLAKSNQSDEQTIMLTGGRLEVAGANSEALPEQTISIRITLHYPARIDLEYKVENKEATPLVESTVVPFPLNLPKASFRLGQTGSVIDPARDIASGANRNLWCANWVDVSDDRVGFAILPLDMPLVSIGNTGIYRFEPERIPTEPLVYAHLSNTQWGTNFPQWLEGDFSFRIRLQPQTGNWSSHLLWLEFKEQVVPFIAGNPWGLVIQSVRPRHDGRGLIVRFWNAGGIHDDPPFILDDTVSAVWRCDLMENPLESLQLGRYGIRNDSVSVRVPVKPYSIETLLIEFDKQ
jgi:alpha-mannosidase